MFDPALLLTLVRQVLLVEPNGIVEGHDATWQAKKPDEVSYFGRETTEEMKGYRRAAFSHDWQRTTFSPDNLVGNWLGKARDDAADTGYGRIGERSDVDTTTRKA
ncbi:hypothetical protein IF2G_02511 [Cordyceps javanica]|nr:hypothetical protein IF2G_02511 [Cordyceps javanica]